MKPRHFVFAIVALLVIYPLSAGPVLWMVDSGILPPKAYSWTYRPILQDNAMGYALGKYIDLWTPRSQPLRDISPSF